MQNKSFQSGITANISASEAIKKISKVADWWGVNFSGNSEKQNDKFVVKMGGDSFFNFTVAEIIPDKRVVWLVTDCHMPWYADKKEWANTKLIFDLSENVGVTSLNFTHDGLTPEIQCYKDCELGWTHWIKTSLYSYFTTGTGQFKQKTTTKYSVSIEVAKPVNEVFNHLTNDVAKFWAEELHGETNKLNDEFTFTTGDTHYSKNRITELVPDKKVVWFTTESIRKTDNFDWTGTKMIFELIPKGNNTLIEYTYDGVVLENEMERLRQICDMVIKENLYNLLTIGKAK